MSEKNALLIIDMQKDFNPAPELIERISKIKNRYRDVVFTRFVSEPDSLFCSHLDNRVEGGDLVIKPGSNDIVIVKPGYGLPAWYMTSLARINKRWDLCGLETDASVLACAFSFFDAGIVPNVLIDCCQSQGQKNAEDIIHSRFHSPVSSG